MTLYSAETPTDLVIEEIPTGKRHSLSSDHSCVEMSDVELSASQIKKRYIYIREAHFIYLHSVIFLMKKVSRINPRENLYK